MTRFELRHARSLFLQQTQFRYSVRLVFFCTFCRKMLIADINELKYQQEDAKKPNVEEEGEGKEDVTFLKLALK